MKSSDEIASNQPEPRFFYFAAQYRRAILWILGGLVLVVAVGQILLALDNRFELERLLGACTVVVLIATLSSSLLGPRLRIDHDGISRRSWGRWDLWPWEAFAEGRVRLGKIPGQYEFPERRCFANELHLELLEAEDARIIEELIRKVWHPPDPIVPPDSIVVHVSGPGPRTIELTQARLRLCSSEGVKDYRWDQCATIQIWRSQHDHRRYLEIIFCFDDDKITCCGWENTAPLPEFLCQHARPELIQHLARSGPARSIFEVDLRTQKLDLDLSQRQSMQRWIPVVLVGVLVVIPLVLGWRCVLMSAMYAPLFYAIEWMGRERIAEIKQKLRDLDSDRARLLEGNHAPKYDVNVSPLNSSYSPLRRTEQTD